MVDPANDDDELAVVVADRLFGCLKFCAFMVCASAVLIAWLLGAD